MVTRLTSTNEIVGLVAPTTDQGDDVIDMVATVQGNRTPPAETALSGILLGDVVTREFTRSHLERASILVISAIALAVFGTMLSSQSQVVIASLLTMLAIVVSDLFAVLSNVLAVDLGLLLAVGRMERVMAFDDFSATLGILSSPLIAQFPDSIRIVLSPFSILRKDLFGIRHVVGGKPFLLALLTVWAKSDSVSSEVFRGFGERISALGAGFQLRSSAVFNRLSTSELYQILRISPYEHAAVSS